MLLAKKHRVSWCDPRTRKQRRGSRRPEQRSARRDLAVGPHERSCDPAPHFRKHHPPDVDSGRFLGATATRWLLSRRGSFMVACHQGIVQWGAARIRATRPASAHAQHEDEQGPTLLECPRHDRHLRPMRDAARWSMHGLFSRAEQVAGCPTQETAQEGARLWPFTARPGAVGRCSLSLWFRS
jgi:hypothetical protein